MIPILISEDKAKGMLKEFEPLIVEAYYDALKATNQQAKYAIGIPNKSATAFNMNSNVINAFKSKTSHIPYVQIIPKSNTFIFLISDTLAAKFKKHNKKGLSSNAKSKQIGFFNGQQLQLLFPNVPILAYLEFAYRTDNTYSEFEFIKITCTYNKQVIWDIDLTDTNFDTGSKEIPVVPIEPKTITPSKRKITITGKKDKAIND